jgi:hypothetical protein
MRCIEEASPNKAMQLAKRDVFLRKATIFREGASQLSADVMRGKMKGKV